MNSMDSRLVEYFSKNEKDIENLIFQATYSLSSKGIRQFEFHDNEGNCFSFTRVTFYKWKKDKEIYNSPLYKEMQEDE